VSVARKQPNTTDRRVCPTATAMNDRQECLSHGNYQKREWLDIIRRDLGVSGSIQGSAKMRIYGITG
jgi:hypothetical protein